MSQINLTAGHPIFDTLGYFQRLKAAGMPEEQAQVQVDALREIVEDKLATKRDLLDLRDAMRHEFKDVRQEIKDVRADMQSMEYRLIIRLGAMLAASMAVVAALVKLL
jgi:hypothetical protein